MTIWAEFEATDHVNNTNNASFSISVGARVGSVIEVEMQTVTMNRVANEMADIAVNMTLINGNSTTVFNTKFVQIFYVNTFNEFRYLTCGFS